MMKLKYFSVYSDFKTSYIAKFFFLISGIFLVIVLLVKLINFFFNVVTNGVIGFFVSLADSSFLDISLAMIILFAGLGGIALFFHHQFKKLASIADEIEKLDSIED